MTLHPRNDMFAAGKTRWYAPPIMDLLLMLGITAAILFLAAAFNFLGELAIQPSIELRLLSVLIFASAVFPLGRLVSILRSWLRLWRGGQVMPGIVIAVQEHWGGRYNAPWVQIDYRFMTPDGHERSHTTAKIRSSLSPIRTPAAGDPIAVLYVSDNLHALL